METKDLTGWQRVLVMMALRDREFVDFLERIIKEVKNDDGKRKNH